jgi:hypothetical protein
MLLRETYCREHEAVVKVHGGGAKKRFESCGIDAYGGGLSSSKDGTSRDIIFSEDAWNKE